MGEQADRLIEQEMDFLTNGCPLVPQKSKIICPYCNKEAVWTENKAMYGRNYGKSYMCYYCKPCDAYVGCHNNTEKPLGTMANRELRKLRKKVHNTIDHYWKSGKMRRSYVYNLLNNHYGRSVHVGESDVEMCKDLILNAERILEGK